jgi:hypothetical protein
MVLPTTGNIDGPSFAKIWSALKRLTFLSRDGSLSFHGEAPFCLIASLRSKKRFRKHPAPHAHPDLEIIERPIRPSLNPSRAERAIKKKRPESSNLEQMVGDETRQSRNLCSEIVNGISAESG